MNPATRNRKGSIAIACSVGGFKGVFLHGVLTAFEEAGFRAEAYAAASSSVLPAVMAAIGRTAELGLGHWINGLRTRQQSVLGMSDLVLSGLDKATPTVQEHLFLPDMPRFLIAANRVNETGAWVTQGKRARRLGRQLLLAAAHGDRSWVDAHLILHHFDTQSTATEFRLTPCNFKEVAYASSRMLHAWDIGAWIGEGAWRVFF